MAQLTIQLSSKAEALIAQLQKQIFNRRRKKVSAAGVVETLLESGAKSQSDKRFATSWRNLVDDIEKAAAITHRHGTKPAAISDQEWALILSHRSRTGALSDGPVAAKPAQRQAAAARTSPSAAKSTAKTATKTATKPKPATTAVTAKPATPKAATRSAKLSTAKVGNEKKVSPVRATPGAVKPAKTTAKSAKTPAKATPTPKATAAKPRSSSSLAKRMAKAVSRLSTSTVAPLSNGDGPLPAAASPQAQEPQS